MWRFWKCFDSVGIQTEMIWATAVSHSVSPVCPVPGVEHVRHQIVLVLSVYQLGCVVAGEPAVHALSPAVDPPALLNHRHRSVLHLQDGRGFRVSSSRKLRQSHLLIQELTWKWKQSEVQSYCMLELSASVCLTLRTTDQINLKFGFGYIKSKCLDVHGPHRMISSCFWWPPDLFSSTSLTSEIIIDFHETSCSTTDKTF